MEDFVYYNYLYDIYNFVLTAANKRIFEYYYADNLSMQEIADLLHVSKSFISSSVKKTISKLDDMEANLKVYQNKKKLQDILNLNNIEEIKKQIKKLL